MVLTGPVKSGKTDVLNLVLPSIIAREHLSGGRRRPFIVRFTFDLRQRPELAAATLLDAVKVAVAPLGITVNVERSPDWALRNVTRVLGDVADAIMNMDAELWLLMDECQVRGTVQQCLISLAGVNAHIAFIFMSCCRHPFFAARRLMRDSYG